MEEGSTQIYELQDVTYTEVTADEESPLESGSTLLSMLHAAEIALTRPIIIRSIRQNSPIAATLMHTLGELTLQNVVASASGTAILLDGNEVDYHSVIGPDLEHTQTQAYGNRPRIENIEPTSALSAANQALQSRVLFTAMHFAQDKVIKQVEVTMDKEEMDHTKLFAVTIIGATGRALKAQGLLIRREL